MLVLFVPANVYAAIYHVPQGGHAWGLLIRAPLQLIILLWIYWFRLGNPSRDRALIEFQGPEGFGWPGPPRISRPIICRAIIGPQLQ
jgi:hypothetical protein